MNDTPETAGPPITELSARQRRVLGVLVEKGLMTPEYYPLTLKAVVAGCNQKSNRDPVVNYSEDDAEEALNELRELGLAAVVHTESGRTERFRHYVRKRFTLTEPQLAILVELLLRGRQTPGSLRSRAGRMVPIDSLEDLRRELTGLMEMDLVRADGPLERRGVEVDHNLYPDSERKREAGRGMQQPAAAVREAASDSTAGAAGIGDSKLDRFVELSQAVERLTFENRDLRSDLGDLQEQVRLLRDQVDQLRRELGD